MGFNLLHTISKGTKSIGHQISKSTKPTRKWFKGAGDTIGHTASGAVKWTKNQAEKLVDDVGNLTNPMTIIAVAGAAVLIVVLMKYKK